jgi:dephospho-CoA kinase
MLVARGAILIDADQIAREVVEPGTPAYEKVVEHFGRGILLPDERIDREALGRIVFDDPEKLAALNSMTHPAVMDRFAERFEELKGTDHVVIADIPLLAEVGGRRAGGSLFDLIVVVTAPEDVQLERLRQTRGMEESDARARIASQLRADERAAIADVIIVNDGTTEELAAEVDRLWKTLEAKRGGQTAQ